MIGKGRGGVLIFEKGVLGCDILSTSGLARGVSCRVIILVLCWMFISYITPESTFYKSKLHTTNYYSNVAIQLDTL